VGEPDLHTSTSFDVRDISVAQMGFEVSTASTNKAEVMQFSDGAQQYKVDMKTATDSTRSGQDSVDDNLATFLSRPIRIHEESWVTGTDFQASFNPWTDYFTQSKVAARIDNYNLLRCKLHLKFMINGNSFLYGKAMASYLPHAALDSLSLQGTLVQGDLVQMSQMPHLILDPTTSTGGEMVLPFFYYKNNLNIPNAEWANMGNIYLKSINQLLHANAATERVTITVLAWAEDVQLSIPTSIAQMGVEQEEGNNMGMISGPATAVANVAGIMSSIPRIAPFAKATQSVAQQTAAVAKIFGFSRPTRTNDPGPMKPKAFSDLAVTTTPDGATKLTVDDQQELSIDPRIAGLADDEDTMVITNISQRESYLTSFNWGAATAPDGILWNTRVTPVAWAEGANGALYLPACCMAALPFLYWTGTIKLRFQIAASGFHRGRLRIVYDPNYITGTDFNVNYSEIVDIQEKKDFCICISNNQEKTFLLREIPGLSAVTSVYKSTAFTNSSPYSNGTLGVYVLNELTTPNDTATQSVEVNVFISTGDDFEVAVPCDDFAKYVARPQMGKEVDEDANQDQNRPSGATADCDMTPNKTMNENLYDVYMGESIKSFRPLLKRYALHEAVGPLDSTDTVISMQRSYFPYLRGNVNGAVHLSSGGANPYNFVNTLLLHWITLAHSGIRGGVRYKILPRGDMTFTNKINNIEVQRTIIQSGDKYKQQTIAWDSYTTASDAAKAAVVGSNYFLSPYNGQSLPGFTGKTRNMDRVNINTEFELPFYSDGRYFPGKVQNWTTAVGVDVVASTTWVCRIFTQGGVSSLFEIHAAAAEDFQCLFWTGMPPLYYEGNAPSL